MLRKTIWASKRFGIDQFFSSLNLVSIALLHPAAGVGYLAGSRKGFQRIVLHNTITRSARSLLGAVDPDLEEEILELETFRKDLWSKLHSRASRWSPMSPEECNYLYMICRMLKPRHIVETGVQHGLSSAFFLKALERNGSGVLHSIDLPSKEYASNIGTIADKIPPDVDSGWLVPKKLREGWNLKLGESKLILPKLLDELQEIDLFLHDSEHTEDMMRFEYSLAWKHLRRGGVLMSDDIDLGQVSKEFFPPDRAVGANGYRKGISKLSAVVKS